MEWERFAWIDGTLFRRWWSTDGKSDSWQLVPRAAYREEMIRFAHEGFGGGHLGIRKTRAKVQAKAFWPGWQADVDRSVSRCAPCASYFRGTPAHRGKLQLDQGARCGRG